MNLVFRRKAVNDLRGIFNYIAQDSLQSASETVARVTDSIDLLRDFPLLGRPGMVSKTRELVIAVTAYICVYRARKDAVEIVAIFHGAQRRG